MLCRRGATWHWKGSPQRLLRAFTNPSPFQYFNSDDERRRKQSRQNCIYSQQHRKPSTFLTHPRRNNFIQKRNFGVLSKVQPITQYAQEEVTKFMAQFMVVIPSFIWVLGLAPLICPHLLYPWELYYLIGIPIMNSISNEKLEIAGKYLTPVGEVGIMLGPTAYILYQEPDLSYFVLPFVYTGFIAARILAKQFQPPDNEK